MASSAAAQSSDPALEHARKLLSSAPLIDGHNDLPWEIRESKTLPATWPPTTFARRRRSRPICRGSRRGRSAAQFWSIYIPGEIKDSGYARVQLEQFDIARRMIARYPDRLALALTADDIERDFKRGRLASLLGMEGGHAIENSLGALRSYYELGARYMTLTHNVTLDWADAALDSARHGGLTEFGKEVVREMNRLGMLVDLSHVVAGDHERRARRERGAGHLLPLGGPRAGRASAERARLDPGPPAEERRRGDGDLRACVRLSGSGGLGYRVPAGMGPVEGDCERYQRAAPAGR